jgi:hypothetical protein
MNISKASRKKAKMRLSISGPSGSGKTYSALLVAYGLTGNLSKVCVIDTENSSAELYAHLGDYSTIQLAAPFVPEKFIDAIKLCEQAEIETIIIDSASHEWDGLGGILDIHASIPGNSFTAWSKVTPRHNAFIQTMLQSSCHIITTVRSKTEYVLSDKNGKQVPEKVGMKGIQKDGFEYDATLAFELNINHTAQVSKDRTGLFIGKHDFVLAPEVGRKIKQWCDEGETLGVNDVSARINDCRTIQELLDVYHKHPEFNGALQPEFEQKKRNILINQEVQKELAHQKISTNGTDH